ncbi:hypothetical protein BDP27DRAFT_1323562 [Rhodocollybia butyracea]|uniref:Flavin reductase like domain-containing protein n=1 Tax=Rhodocollybia butyracea TaxID=206335 RepID=A0A9P5U858_9AGAR|nr:hypothetical protein BDP27DRAFT_1323562 [Rhodocollybia butyracea]
MSRLFLSQRSLLRRSVIVTSRQGSNSSLYPSRMFNSTSSSGWKFGDGASLIPEHQNSSRRTYDLDEMSTKDSYRLLTSAIIPRPIALVSTIAEDGTPNLAPFSYFSLLSHNPPLLSVCFTLSPRRPKDTRQNILATKEFTVNIISEHLAEAANSTSLEAPADVDEWVVSGLTMEPSSTVKPACVKESLVSMECELHFSHDISNLKSSDITNTLVVGLIKQVHVRESALAENGLELDPAKLKPIARLGGTAYSRLTDTFDIPRPSWTATEETVAELMQRSKKG